MNTICETLYNSLFKIISLKKLFYWHDRAFKQDAFALGCIFCKKIYIYIGETKTRLLIVTYLLVVFTHTKKWMTLCPPVVTKGTADVRTKPLNFIEHAAVHPTLCPALQSIHLSFVSLCFPDSLKIEFIQVKTQHVCCS